MQLVPVIGTVLITLAIALDLLSLRQAVREYRRGVKGSMIPFVSLLLSVPGGIMLILWYRLWHTDWIAIVISAALLENLTIQLLLPMIVSRFIRKHEGS